MTNDSLIGLKLHNSDRIAVVDAEFANLTGFSWGLDSHGYPRRRGKEDWVYLHTDILGDGGELLTDHINRDPLDNRKVNLLFVMRGQNVVNSPKAKRENPTSQHKGVSWDKDRSKWVASICVNDKRMNLGRFASEDDAARAYNNAAVRHFGVSAFLNTVSDGGMVGGLDASTRKDEEHLGKTSLLPEAERIRTSPASDIASEISVMNEPRNRINRIISGCLTRGMSSEAITDEVWEYLRLNAPKVRSAQLSAILKRLEFVEDRAIGILAGPPGRGYYESWNDGEYEVSKATKELRSIIHG